MFIAMAGEISAGSETPAKARKGVDGFRGRLRNQTGSSGRSRLRCDMGNLLGLVM